MGVAKPEMGQGVQLKLRPRKAETVAALQRLFMDVRRGLFVPHDKALTVWVAHEIRLEGCFVDIQNID